jgi:hypothetical protein
MTRVADERVDVGRLETTLVREQSLEARDRLVAGHDGASGARELQRLSAGCGAEIRHSHAGWDGRILRDKRRRRILHEKQSLLECAKLGERDSARDRNAVAYIRCVGDVNTRRLEHRFELLPYYSVRPQNYRGLGVVQSQQALGVLLSPTFDPPRDEPARMRMLGRQGFDRIGRSIWNQLVALAIRSAQDRVHELAGAESVSAFRELDCLRDSGVSWNAAHVRELVDAEPQEINHIGIETRKSAANPIGENRIDPAAVTQHAVNELAGPAAVARVERNDPTIERLIEEFAAPQIDADLCSNRARSGDRARRNGSRVHDPIIPVVGDDGTATSRRGIRPAR